jgi:MFS family permease
MRQVKQKQKQRRLLLYTNFVHIFGLSILAPVYALYGLKLGATAWQIGASWGLYYLIAGVGNIIVGRWIDGTGRNRMFVVSGYILTIVGIILFLFAKSPSQLYIIQAVSALGLALYMPAWKALYTRSENRDRLASQWGLFDGTNMIAMAGAAILAGYLVNINKYTLMFSVIIALYGISTVMALRLKASP